MKSYFDAEISERVSTAGGGEDGLLLRRAAAGDGDAFATLFRRHRDGLQGFLFRRLQQREAAEDALTLTFYKAWRARSSYRGEASGKSWLYQIAARVALDELRRTQPERLDLGQPAEELPHILNDQVQDPEEMILEAEARRATCGAVSSALARLSREERELVHLHYFEGCDYGQISQRVGITLSQVRGRLHRIRERMRRDLAGRPDFQTVTP